MSGETPSLLGCCATVDRAEVGNPAAQVMGRQEEGSGDREGDSVRAATILVAVDQADENERGVDGRRPEATAATRDHRVARVVEPYPWSR